jgi:hypothetical protein
MSERTRARTSVAVSKCRWLEALAIDPELTALDIRVAVIIGKFLRRDELVSIVGEKKIAKLAKATVRGIQKSRRRIEAKGYLEIAAGCGRGRWTTYRPRFEKAVTPERTNARAGFIPKKGEPASRERANGGAIESYYESPVGPSSASSLKRAEPGLRKIEPRRPSAEDRATLLGNLRQRVGDDRYFAIYERIDQELLDRAAFADRGQRGAGVALILRAISDVIAPAPMPSNDIGETASAPTHVPRGTPQDGQLKLFGPQRVLTAPTDESSVELPPIRRRDGRDVWLYRHRVTIAGAEYTPEWSLGTTNEDRARQVQPAHIAAGDRYAAAIRRGVAEPDARAALMADVRKLRLIQRAKLRRGRLTG